MIKPEQQIIFRPSRSFHLKSLIKATSKRLVAVSLGLILANTLFVSASVGAGSPMGGAMAVSQAAGKSRPHGHFRQEFLDGQNLRTAIMGSSLITLGTIALPRKAIYYDYQGNITIQSELRPEFGNYYFDKDRVCNQIGEYRFCFRLIRLSVGRYLSISDAPNPIIQKIFISRNHKGV